MELSAPTLMKRTQTHPTTHLAQILGELVLGWVKKAEEQWGVSIEEKGTSGSFGPTGRL